MKFVLDLIIILQEIDDHRIIVNIFIDFDQYSVSNPYYITIQMTIEFFKIYMTKGFLQNSSWILSEYLQRVDDQRNILNFFIYLDQNSFSQPYYHSDDLKILQQLYDNRILVKFDQNSSRNG